MHSFKYLRATYFGFGGSQTSVVSGFGDSPNQLGSAFSWLTDFFKNCVGYLSFSTNEKPFPLTRWTN